MWYFCLRYKPTTLYRNISKQKLRVGISNWALQKGIYPNIPIYIPRDQEEADLGKERHTRMYGTAACWRLMCNFMSKIPYMQSARLDKEWRLCMSFHMSLSRLDLLYLLLVYSRLDPALSLAASIT